MIIQIIARICCLQNRFVNSKTTCRLCFFATVINQCHIRCIFTMWKSFFGSNPEFISCVFHFKMFVIAKNDFLYRSVCICLIRIFKGYFGLWRWCVTINRIRNFKRICRNIINRFRNRKLTLRIITGRISRYHGISLRAFLWAGNLLLRRL